MLLQIVNGGAVLQIWKVLDYMALAIVDSNQGVVFQVWSLVGS
jgi:hypothetical protein